MVLEVQGLTKSYHQRRILDAVGFSIDAGEFFSIIGPSGSGKSTLLKIIARLETPDTGTLRFEKKPDQHSPVILVFQDLQLFPHLTVYENVAFGLRARKLGNQEIEKKVTDVLTQLGISKRAGSFPATLSGGEQQRTALARALVLNPQILLLDEPFSNLDPSLKKDAAMLIRETTRMWNTPVICVTHDFEEAFSVSDRIGILLEGRMVQTGPPQEVFYKPVSLEAARFMGPVNHLPAELVRKIRCPFGKNGTGKGEIFRDEIKQDMYVRPKGLEFLPFEGGDAELIMSCFFGHRVLHVVEWEGRRWEVGNPPVADLVPGTRGKLIFHM